jgi:hypothetical protein
MTVIMLKYLFVHLYLILVVAHITVQRQQGAIAIAISTPQSSPRKIGENGFFLYVLNLNCHF